MLSASGNAAYHNRGELRWGSKAMGGLETLGELFHQGGELVRPVAQPSPGLGGLKGAEVGFQIKVLI